MITKHEINYAARIFAHETFYAEAAKRVEVMLTAITGGMHRLEVIRDPRELSMPCTASWCCEANDQQTHRFRVVFGSSFVTARTREGAMTKMLAHLFEGGGFPNHTLASEARLQALDAHAQDEDDAEESDDANELSGEQSDD